MSYKNIKHSILFSFLPWVGSVQSGYVRETARQETVPEMQAAVFTLPSNFPITFSDNFGEICSSHSHSGLDLETGGVVGEPVCTLADGHISYIRVTRGSGYVLDVDYDNSYSIINRRLSAFIGDVARRVKELQYKKESWEVEIAPEPREYPVKAEQVIALSGNTGYSFGPHLCLDMIEPATGGRIGPLPFFMEEMKDNTTPHAEGIILSPQPDRGVMNEKQTRQTFPVNPAKSIAAWGLVGMGIHAYDYMNGMGNRYGVRIVISEVDGTGVFCSVVDRSAHEENCYINSWTRGQYMKLFVELSDCLRTLYASNGNRGLIGINEERLYCLVYTLSDALGNTSKTRPVIQGKSTAIRLVEHHEKYAFKWDKTNYLQEPGLELVVPWGTLYDDVWLNYSVRVDNGNVAFTYQLNDTRIPIHGAHKMCIGLRRDGLGGKLKYYVAGVTAEGEKCSVGGVCEDSFMKVRIRDLAAYMVAVDTVSSETIPLNLQQRGRTDRIVFRAKNKGTGVDSCRGTIGGKYAPFGKSSSTSSNLVCEFDPEHVKKGGRHIVEMTVMGGCGNQTAG